MKEKPPFRLPRISERNLANRKRKCCACDKTGGTRNAILLQVLRERGYPLKNDSEYIHTNCALTARRELGI